MANRLGKEKSPYLRQHATNPVDWYPWGEEAFGKARQEGKPVFLSIGYSTCHWCHVMEEESFENPRVAALLNRYFVSVKVDREERPDIDHVYMRSVQAMTGAGGWPLSVFLTPELEPFYGGTYFPAEDHYGRPGFISVLEGIRERWDSGRGDILRAGTEMKSLLEESLQGNRRAEEIMNPGCLTQAAGLLMGQYDKVYGGFGTSPKFPTPHLLSFLLRVYKRTGASVLLETVEHTLRQMRGGGIYDQLGGGFHRYATDERWHVPHFEKMLYDQALIARTYLEAWQITRAEEFRETASSILDYVLRDLTGPEGAFYSAEDADSELPGAVGNRRAEGAFYVWTWPEVEEAAGRDAGLAAAFFGIEPGGNVRQDPFNEFRNKNVLFQAVSMEALAGQFSMSVQETRLRIETIREKMLKQRAARPRPFLDDKVLTDWNGMMISTLALAGSIFRKDAWLKAAQRAAEFILGSMLRSDGFLCHRWREGEALAESFLDDYAWLATGLLDLYEGTFEIRYLQKARELVSTMVLEFGNGKTGGFYLTRKSRGPLPSRPMSLYDGAVPSGNSVAVYLLLRMARMTGDREMETLARRTLESFGETIASSPAQYASSLFSVDFLLGPVYEIVIVPDNDKGNVSELSGEIFRHYLPNRILVLRRGTEDEIPLHPFVKDRAAGDRKTRVYVCRDNACQLPVSDVNGLREVLASGR